MRSFQLSTPWDSYYPGAREIKPGRARGAPETLEFLNEDRVRSRLVRAARGLDGDGYRVCVFQRGGDGGRGHVPRGVEQAARLRLVVADDPDLARAVFRHGRHVLDDEDGAVVLEGRHLRFGALLGPCAAEFDLARLLGLVRGTGLFDLTLEVLHVPQQQDVPRQEADDEQGR